MCQETHERTGGYLDLSRGIAGVRRHGGGRRHGEEEEDGELGHWDPNPIGVWGDWMSVSFGECRSGCGADHIGRKLVYEFVGPTYHCGAGPIRSQSCPPIWHGSIERSEDYSKEKFVAHVAI